MAGKEKRKAEEREGERETETREERKARKKAKKARKRREEAEEGEQQQPGEEEDAPFVRGRVAAAPDTKAAAGKAAAAVSHDEDTLFGVRPADKRREAKKKAKKRRTPDRAAGEGEDEDSAAAVAKRARRAAAQEAPSAVHAVAFSSLRQGHLLLGYVRAVTELDVAVGLPGGLTGFVSVREVSDVLAARVDSFLARDDADDDDDGGGGGKADELVRLDRYLKPNQLVAVAVVGLERRTGKSNRIELTMRPSKVNAGLVARRLVRGMPVHGSVRSAEERGLVIDLGLADGVTGFLPYSRASPGEDGANEAAVRLALQPGRPVACVVRSAPADGDRIVQLTRERPPKTMANDPSDPRPLALGALKPGMVVEATVQKVIENGLFVSFLGFFHGCVDLAHLPAPAAKGWEELCAAGQTGPARVLFVDPEKKRALLSMLPSLADAAVSSAPAPPVAVGTVVEAATVVRRDAHAGLLMRLNAAGAHGYAHISRLTDDGGAMARNKVPRDRYGSGTEHRCRVIGFNALDAQLQLSLQASVIEAPVLRAADAVPGMLLRGEVLTVSAEHGARVSIARGVTARLSALHLADVRLREPQRKLPPGKKVRVRVLRYDAERDRLHVTNKRTLVRSELPVVDSYAAAAKLRGQVVHGFVTSARDSGCIVEFYNGVCGHVTAEELRRCGVAGDIEDAYTPGQVVKARVLRCKPKKSRLYLSFGLEPSDEEKRSAAERAAAKSARRAVALSVRPGTVLPAGARAVTLERATELAAEAGLTGTLRAPDGQLLFEVEVPGGDKEETTRRALGLVEAAHLSDHPDSGARLHESYAGLAAEGSLLAEAEPLGRAVVLRTVLGGAAVQLSAKPSLAAAAAAGCLPSRSEELHEGQLLSGYVSNVQKFGVFVAFCGTASGLAPMKELSDQYIANAAEHFSMGQSVRATVRSVDTKGKVTVTLRPSVCDPAPGAEAAAPEGDSGKWARLAGQTTLSFVSSLVAERAALGRHAALLRRAAGKPAVPAAAPTGAPASGVVTAAKSNALVVRVGGSDEPAYVVVRPRHAEEGREYAKGDEVTGCVMDSDPAKGIVDLSLRPGLAAAAEKGARRVRKFAEGRPSKKDALLVGTETRAVVEYVKKDLLVLSLPDHGSRVGLAAARTYNLQVSGRSVFHAGYRCTARVVAAGEPLLLAVDLNAALRRHTEGRKDRPRAAGEKGGAGAAPADANGHSRGDDDNDDDDDDDEHKKSSKDEFFDSSVRSEADLVPGRVVQCRVLSVRSNCVVVAFSLRSGHRLMGRVHVSELLGAAGSHARGMADSKTNPLELWRDRVGSVVPLKVLTREATERRSKGKDGRERVSPALLFQLTARPADLAEPDREAAPRPGPGDLRRGERVLGFVDRVSDDAANPWVVVSLTPTLRGRVGAREISDRPAVLKDLAARFPPGRAVSCVVLGTAAGHDDRLVLSLTRKDGDVVPEEEAGAAEAGGDGGRPSTPHEKQTVEVGRVISVRVARVLPGEGLSVEIGPARFGRVHITDVADGWPRHPLKGVRVGHVMRARVLAVREEKRHTIVDLTTRESAVAGGADLGGGGGGGVNDASALSEGDVVRGYVKHTASSGCFVSIGRAAVARVLITNLSDDYVRNVEDKFKPGKLVTGRVLSVDSSSGRVELTLKKSAVEPDKATKRLTLADIEKGMLVRGRVSSVAEFGAFVYIDHSDVRALIHKSDIADEFVTKVAEHISKEDRVKAVVVGVDADKKRVNLSIKPSAMAEAKAKSRADADAEEGEEDDDDDDDEEEEEEEEEEQEEEEDSDEEMTDGKVLEAVGDSDDADSDAGYQQLLKEAAASGMNTYVAGGSDDDEDGEESDDASDSDSDSDSSSSDSDSGSASDDSGSDSGAGSARGPAAVAAPSPAPQVDMADVPSLSVSSAAFLGGSGGGAAAALAANGHGGDSSDSSDDDAGDDNDDDDDDGDGSDNGGTPASRSAARSAKARAKKRDERRVTEREEAMLDQDRAPESAADYERMLVGSPSNSFLWIKYMAFQLGLSEIGKARAVARRALSTINFREESERLNVWVALLNLECMYGTPAELAAAFKEALRNNDPLQVRLKMCEVYEKNNKLEQAEECYAAACRKAGGDEPRVWEAFGEFHFRQGNADKARAVMQRALNALPRSDRVAVIGKFARLEYREQAGSVDRGRTLFEGVLSSFPKKVDVWSVYLDMEMMVARRGASNQDAVRRIFERALKLRVSSKKIKFLFKRFLAYEKEFGDTESQAHVKALAKAYVEDKLQQMQERGDDEGGE